MDIELNQQQIHALYDMEDWWNNSKSQIYELAGCAGCGKALTTETFVATPNGPKMIGDIAVGDYVYNERKEPVKVLGVYDQGERIVYTVTFQTPMGSREVVECDIEHLWTVLDYTEHRKVTLTLGEIIENSRKDSDTGFDETFRFYNNGKEEILHTRYYFPYYNSGITASISIEEIKVCRRTAHMKCIFVDTPSHLFLLQPGMITHNTTLIKYFIDYIGLDIEDVLFVAFQGKAAMQMSRHKLPAKTIHAAIYDFEKVVDYDENGKLQLDENGKIKKKFEFVLKDEIPSNPKLIVVDEAGMVGEKNALDLLSFGIPIVALGDLNQLPPVMAKPFFLKKPNFVLTQVMRQSEKNPIVWLSQQVLQNNPLHYGVYGDSQIIPKSSLSEFQLHDSDIVLTCTNRLRHEINTLFRENILNIKKLDLPCEGEKIICRKNNWHRSIEKMYYLTNGMTGTIDYIDPSTFDGKGIKIDFKPDFTKKCFRNLVMDYKSLFQPEKAKDELGAYDFKRNKFEFAYAITTWLSQGSEFDNVVFLLEQNGINPSIKKQILYTAITRAKKKITIVI